MSREVLTVSIAAYNVENHIRQTLDSLISRNLSPDTMVSVKSWLTRLCLGAVLKRGRKCKYATGSGIINQKI